MVEVDEAEVARGGKKKGQEKKYAILRGDPSDGMNGREGGQMVTSIWVWSGEEARKRGGRKGGWGGWGPTGARTCLSRGRGEKKQEGSSELGQK